MVIVSFGKFCMLNSLGEAWVFRSIIFTIPLVVGHQILPTTLRILTHMNHVHTAPTLIVVQVIVHIGDNFPIFHMSRWRLISLVLRLNRIQIFNTKIGATILIYQGKLMLQEIMLPNLMDCTILNICSPIIHLLDRKSVV